MGLTVESGPSYSQCKAAQKGSVWNLGNDVLYTLCREHPDHRTTEEIIAKVWLIGRSYAAPIERGKLDELASESFYPDVVAPIVEASSLDAELREIHRERRCESREDASAVLHIHNELVKTFRRASGKANRSLASKYLHFHRPLFFPIFDSRANAAIREFTSGAVSSDFPQGDKEYRGFLARYMALNEWIISNYKLHLTPREVDRVLLRY